MTAQTQNISTKDRKLAQTFLERLQTNNDMALPPLAVELFVDVLKNMADGKRVAVVPVSSEVSTQEAANYLNVSRPYVVKLLEKGLMPFKKVGVRRRIAYTDLIAYKDKLVEDRRTQLAFLVNQAQELNMGYE